MRKGVYVVPTDRWYIERTVWLIAGLVLLGCTLLAVLVNPLWIFGVIATGLVSINVALTGFCPIGNVLYRLGFKPRLGQPNRGSIRACCAQAASAPSTPDGFRLAQVTPPLT